MSGNKDAALEQAAEVVADEAAAQAAAAKAIADKKTSEAVTAVAAAAEGTAALSQSVAAAVVDENTKKLRTVEEQQSWLETQMENLSAAQQAMPLLIQEQVKAELSPMQEALSRQLSQMQELIHSPNLAKGEKQNEGADGLGEAQKRRATDNDQKPNPPAKKKYRLT